MKPGYKTTEFWITLGTALWGAFEPAAPAWARAVVPGAASVAYAVARGLAKHGAFDVGIGNP